MPCRRAVRNGSRPRRRPLQKRLDLLARVPVGRWWWGWQCICRYRPGTGGPSHDALEQAVQRHWTGGPVSGRLWVMTSSAACIIGLVDTAEQRVRLGKRRRPCAGPRPRPVRCPRRSHLGRRPAAGPPVPGPRPDFVRVGTHRHAPSGRVTLRRVADRDSHVTSLRFRNNKSYVRVVLALGCHGLMVADLGELRCLWWWLRSCCTALIFDFTNGSTHGQTRWPSIATAPCGPGSRSWGGVTSELVGAFLSVQVALTISGGLVDEARITPEVISGPGRCDPVELADLAVRDAVELLARPVRRPDRGDWAVAGSGAINSSTRRRQGCCCRSRCRRSWPA